MTTNKNKSLALRVGLAWAVIALVILGLIMLVGCGPCEPVQSRCDPPRSVR